MTGKTGTLLAAAGMLAAHLIYMGAATPALAMQILDAADHAELAAEISATGVNRIALSHDRIRRVIRAPGGFEVEHDPETGDLYLRPVAAGQGAEPDLSESAPSALIDGGDPVDDEALQTIRYEVEALDDTIRTVEKVESGKSR